MCETQHETATTECPACKEREEQQRRKDLQYVRRTYAGRARDLFDGRKVLLDYLEVAKTADQQFKQFAPTELKLIPAVIRSVGQSCETKIEELAAECGEDHPDLAEGIRFLLELERIGVSAKYETNIVDSQQEERVVLTASPHAFDAETWQRLFELRDVLAELCVGFVASSYTDPDDIPF